MSYAEGLLSQGKLAPKHKDAVVAFLDFAETDTPLEFGEGDAKHTAASGYVLADLPQVVEFGEAATKDKAATRVLVTSSTTARTLIRAALPRIV